MHVFLKCLLVEAKLGMISVQMKIISTVNKRRYTGNCDSGTQILQRLFIVHSLWFIKRPTTV